MKESIIFSDQNLTEKVNYVYRVTIDDKYYIGKRTGFLNDLETGVYKTSSKLVHEKLQNGHHFSKIKILKVFSTEKEALEFEKLILMRVNAKANPKFLNQQNGNGNYTLKQHSEKTKEKLSKKSKAQLDINTEYGRKRRENHSKKMKLLNDINTEEGRKRREHISEIQRNRWDENTERGRINKENHSKSQRNRWDENTELGQQRREEMREIMTKKFDPNTEEGLKRRENRSEIIIEFYKTERGLEAKEKMSKSHKEFYNTEQGKKLRENHSEFMKEKGKNIRQKGAETNLQNRKNASILGELMFDEDFIRQNLLITDDKNNLRFLWSVYSKLTGYKKSSIAQEKREGKLSFLHGINSISISEEQELAKIEEIKEIIKSRNN